MALLQNGVNRLRSTGFRQVGWLFVCIYLAALIGVSFAGSELGPLRYLMYGLPIAAVVGALIAGVHGKVTFDRRFAVAAGCYLAYASLPREAALSALAVRDTSIIFGYLFCFAFNFPVYVSQVRIIFAGVFALFCLRATFRGDFTFDWLSSEGSLEGSESFLGALFFIFFTHRRMWLESALSFLLCVFAFKRVAAGAMIFGISCLYLSGFAYRRFGPRPIAVYALLPAAVVSIAGVVFHSIVTYIFELFDLEVSIDAFFQGRYEIARFLSRVAFEREPLDFALGFGPGAADVLTRYVDQEFGNPHNDWLKIFIDYGYIGLVATILFMCSLCLRSPVQFSVVMATCVMFVTDNLLIYFFYEFALFLIIRADDTEYLQRKVR